MNTYTPIRGMILCANDSGDYVSKTEYDRLETELAALRQRLDDAPVVTVIQSNGFFDLSVDCTRWCSGKGIGLIGMQPGETRTFKLLEVRNDVS